MAIFLKDKSIHHATLLAYQGDRQYLVENKGDLTIDMPIAVASISKLYTDTIVFQLLDQGKLTYSTQLTEVLPKDLTDRLPHAELVTVRHLIDQTSGFSNYETDRQTNGKILMDSILEEDRRVEWDEALGILSTLPSKSSLGGKRAYYADVNAILLGKIAEAVTGKSPESLLDDAVCQPLNLQQTHWATGNESLAPTYKRQDIVTCQQYLASQFYQGGIVTSNRELMRFIRAFFGGELFSPTHISNPTFRSIQFHPLRYGSGMMQLTLSPILSVFFAGVREIRGHSGITGSFAFYCPEKDIFVTGTINQFSKHPYPMIFRVIAAGSKSY